MNGIVQIALAYFRMLQVQLILGAVGAGLVLLALPITLLAGSSGAAFAGMLLAMLGVLLLVMTPAFIGGGAMRQASTPQLLHLRPHSRLRMMLGATLAVTLLAAITVVPVLLAQISNPLFAPRNRIEVSPAVAFAFAWSAFAATWVVTFTLSRSPWMMFLIGLLPLLVVKVSSLLHDWLPAYALILLALALWVGFCLWYLQVRTISRARLQGLNSTSGMESTPLAPLQQWLDRDASQPSRERAVRFYLLGTASPWTFALGGLWLVVIILFMQFLNLSRKPQNMGMAISMAPAMAMMCGAYAFATTRRARYLWLRAGLDRAALFARSERLMFATLPPMLLVAGLALLVMVATTIPDAAPRLPAYAASILLLALCGLYAGMASTHGVTALYVLGVMVIAVLGIVHTTWLLRAAELPLPLLIGSFAFAIALAVLLRWRARRGWLALDWRVATLSRATLRST